MFYIIDIDTESCLSKTTNNLFDQLPSFYHFYPTPDEEIFEGIFWARDFLNLLEALAASLSRPLWPHPPPGAQRPPDGGKEEEEQEAKIDLLLSQTLSFPFTNCVKHNQVGRLHTTQLILLYSCN